MANLVREASMKGVEAKGTRLELIIRLGALLRPELVQALAPGAPQAVVPAEQEAHEEAEGDISVSCDADSGDVPSEVQSEMDKMDPDSRASSVGQHLLRTASEEFSKLLKQAVSHRLEKDKQAVKPKAVPQKPAKARSVWEHFAMYDCQPKYVYCTHCCPPDLAEQHWNLRGRLKCLKVALPLG